MSSRLRAHQVEAERQARLTEDSAFESLVELAVEMVESYDVEPFDAADRLTTAYNYEDFEAVLEAVRSEVECE